MQFPIRPRPRTAALFSRRPALAAGSAFFAGRVPGANGRIRMGFIGIGNGVPEMGEAFPKEPRSTREFRKLHYEYRKTWKLA